MLVVLAAVVIAVGAVMVATGRGGELARQAPPARSPMAFRTAADVASYRPPPALLGYHPGATQQALALIARTLAERDAEVNRLRGMLGLGPDGRDASRELADSPEPSGWWERGQGMTPGTRDTPLT